MILSLLVCFVSCSKAEYSISTDRLPNVIVAGEEPNLDGVIIQRKESSKITEYPVDMNMISGLDTSTAGNKELTVTFGDETFTLKYTVKYKVEFVVDGEVIDTQLVFDNSELSIPTPEAKPGFTFVGFDIPAVISGNVRCEAQFRANSPDIKNVTATYGDTLGDISLPANENGRWEFTAPLEDTVGNAGSHTLEVRFVTNDGEVTDTKEITVTVDRRSVSFDGIVTSFVYDGSSHYPTFAAPEGVTVQTVYGRQTDVGTYNFMLIVDDTNYVGEYSGTFEITRANVTVELGSYTMTYGQSVPKVEYKVSGIDASIVDLGIKVEDLTVMAGRVGIYEFGATVSNKNVNANIIKGSLTVEHAVLDPGTVILIGNDDTVYGDKLSSISFAEHGSGTFAWKDAEADVGEVGTNKHTAIFTPFNQNFKAIEVDVDVKVEKKALILEVSGTSAVYDGDSHSLTVLVKDSEGKLYTDVTVAGNTAYKNAGKYDISLSLDDARYQAEGKYTLTIAKAEPVSDFSPIIKHTWRAGLTLADIPLPEGYSWKSPTTALLSAVSGVYEAVYTPDDTVNYLTVEGEFRLELDKATPEIMNLEAAYETHYTGSVYKIGGLGASYGSGSFSYKYYLVSGSSETLVSEILNAGTYRVEITLLETENYKSVTAETRVTVNKALNKDAVNTSQSVFYLDTVDSLVLPESTIGRWSITGVASGYVFDAAGTKEIIVVFVPSLANEANYDRRTETITVTVNPIQLSVPVIADKTYTGSEQEIVIDLGIAKELYSVTGDTAVTSAGTSYSVTVTLNTENYIWNDGKGGTSRNISFKVNRAPVTITSLEAHSWTFGDEPIAPTYTLTGFVGADSRVEIVFTYEMKQNDGTYVPAAPLNAGEYRVSASVKDTDDYYGTAVTEYKTFTVAKKEIDDSKITVVNNNLVYNGSTQYSGIKSTDVYTVVDNGGINANTETGYTVTITVKPNYCWSSTDSDTVTRTYYIAKASAVIDEAALSVGGFTYGASPSHSGKASFGTVEFRYYTKDQNGEYTEIALSSSSAAGTYYAVAYVEGTVNYNGTETDYIELTVEKASASIVGASASYVTTYTGSAYLPAGLYASYGEGVFTLTDADGKPIVNVGTYENARLTLAESTNYKSATLTGITVTVNPADTSVDDVSGLTATYGDKLSSVELPEADDGIWTWENGDVYVGDVTEGREFNAVFTPYDTNYKTLTTKLTVKVNKAKAEITGLAIESWKYGEAPKEPTATNVKGLGEIKFRYLVGGSFIDELSSTLDAGQYQVQAYITGGSNYEGCETSLLTFTVGRADGSISVSGGLSSVYNGTAYKIPDSFITVSHGDKKNIVYSYKDASGNSVDGMIGVGSYSVTLTQAASNNYTAASATVTVVITAIPNTDDVTAFESVTVPYGTLISAIPLPEGNPKGEWVMVGPDGNEYPTAATVGEIGTHTLRAVFVPNDANYASREFAVTVKVEKRQITAPTASSVYREYDGVTSFTSGISSTADYTVSESPVLTAGTHSVTVTLTDPAHFEWSGGVTSPSVTVTYTVNKAQSNEWTTAPSVSSYTYNGSTPTWTAAAKHDSVSVTYSSDGNSYTSAKPTLPGIYYAKFTTVSKNAVACAETVVSFRIYKVVVTAPTLSVDRFTYGHDEVFNAIKADLTGDKFTPSEFTADLGANTVTLSLNDKSIYCWSFDGTNEDTADKSYSYTVDRISLTIDITAPTGWTYMADKETLPIVRMYDSVNDPEKTKLITSVPYTLVYIYEGKEIEIPSDVSKANLSAGTYTLKLVITADENDPWYSYENTEYSFEVKQAQPVIDLTLDLAPTYYENQIDWEGYLSFYVTRYDGTKYEVPAECDVAVVFNEANSTFTITYTPTDTKNFKGAVKTGAVKLHTVATLGFGGTKYGTIENALDAAENGNEVWVLTNTTGNVRVERDAEIKQGVTLVVPYDAASATSGRNQADSNGNYPSTVYGNATANRPGKAVMTNLVIVSPGVTLTVNGTLEVSGILSGGQGGAAYSGHTTQKYAEIRLDSEEITTEAGKVRVSAEIVINNGGKAKIFGYIKESTKNNSSTVTVNNGGTLEEPLVLYDFKGGSILYAINKKMKSDGYSPFSQFSFMNVSAAVRINYGGNLNAYCNLYAGDQHNATTASMVSASSSGFLQLTDPTYSYLDAKYDVDSGILDLDVYGGANLNSMSLGINLGLLGGGTITVSSSSFVMGLSWILDVTLDNNESAATPQTTATYNMLNKHKLLPGAKLTVEKGAVLNTADLNIYETFYDRLGTCMYPVKNPENSSALSGAELTVRGTLKSTNIGGKVNTDTDGAVVEVTGSTVVTTKEVTRTSGSGLTAKVNSDQSITNSLTLYYNGTMKIGYTERGSSDANVFTSASGTWTASNAITAPATIKITPKSGYHIMTDGAIVGRNADGSFIFAEYDSVRDGIKEIEILPTTKVIFTVAANQLLRYSGTADVGPGEYRSGQVMAEWNATTASDFNAITIYRRVLVTLSNPNSKVSVSEYTITYVYNSSLGYYTANMTLKSSADFNITQVTGGVTTNPNTSSGWFSKTYSYNTTFTDDVTLTITPK